MHLFVL